jgi:hypothetical protein
MKNTRTKSRGNIVKKLILAVIFIFCFSGLAKSQKSGFGLGVMFGEPSGFSFKGWLSERSAIDGGLGWSFVHEGSVQIHADYLYHFYNVFETPNLPLYLGVGGRIKMKNTERNTDTRLGVRIPFGMSYQFTEAPVDIFLEIVPILDLNPSTSGSINGAIGVRYYFK